MEAQIFMKFETFVHKIVIDHQPNFHKDPFKDASAQCENACTCDALQKFRNESTKIKKKLFHSLYLLYQPIDSPKLSVRGLKCFSRGLKRGSPQKF